MTKSTHCPVVSIISKCRFPCRLKKARKYIHPASAAKSLVKNFAPINPAIVSKHESTDLVIMLAINYCGDHISSAYSFT